MKDNKRKSGDSHNQGRKKPAKYFTGNASAPALPLGTQGFLVSCVSGKEYLAAGEAKNLLSEFYEELAGGSNASSAPAGASISAALDEELASLRDRKQEVFSYHKTGVHGLVYIVMKGQEGGPSPVDVIEAAAMHALETQQVKTRLCMRFTPVQRVCQCDMDAISKAAQQLVPPCFPAGPDAQPLQFSVAYEHRANKKLDRMAVINACVELVPQPPHKVNLNNPDKTIIVQLLRNTCAMSVAPGFKKYNKFNLRLLACPEEAEEGEKEGKEEGGEEEGEEAEGEEGKGGAEASPEGEKGSGGTDEKEDEGKEEAAGES